MARLIKICGLSTPETLDAAVDAGATHVGLVHFDKSSRHVSLDTAAQLRRRVPEAVKVVLLLVNADPKMTGEAIATVRPDVVQFHGSETPMWLAQIRKKIGVEVWKALGLRDKEILAKSSRFEGAADRLLFDAPAKKLPGGNGEAFDWQLLADHNHTIDWGLAGGLTVENVGEALTITDAPLVDVSSGVESAPGVKDIGLIKEFCEAVQQFDRQ